jgi:hypothetical protein
MKFDEQKHLVLGYGSERYFQRIRKTPLRISSKLLVVTLVGLLFGLLSATIIDFLLSSG